MECPKGALFLTAERALLKRGAGLLFVCEHERDLFARKIGLAGVPHKVVHNGLWPEELASVAPAADASDVLFIGELRRLKGVGDLIEAISLLSPWRKLSATIVGDGPDRGQFETQAARLGLAQQVNFTGQLTARDAFSRGRILAIPSHAKSFFPYIVLEAVAAEVPLIASNVGGIPEMLPSSSLVPPPSSPRARQGNRLGHGGSMGRECARMSSPSIARSWTEETQLVNSAFTVFPQILLTRSKGPPACT